VAEGIVGGLGDAVAAAQAFELGPVEYMAASSNLASVWGWHAREGTHLA